MWFGLVFGRGRLECGEGELGLRKLGPGAHEALSWKDNVTRDVRVATGALQHGNETKGSARGIELSDRLTLSSVSFLTVRSPQLLSAFSFRPRHSSRSSPALAVLAIVLSSP